MKALRTIVVLCVVFFIANGFVEKVEANTLKTDNFLTGTLGVHTLTGTAFVGGAGFFGVRRTNTGLGFLGSYESGKYSEEGLTANFRIINGHIALYYRLGRSMFIGSYGFNGVTGSAGGEKGDSIGDTFAITYVFKPGRFDLMCQGRLQGQGLMLSAGVGF